MSAPILIAYASRTGSTAEVAEAIAAVLRNAGLQVESAPISTLQSIGERKAVIIGAPLYMGGFSDGLHKFLSRNRDALTATPPRFFVLGPFEAKPEQFDAARAQAEKQLARHSWLTVAELQIFGGRFDVNRMPFPFNLARYLPAFPAKDIPASDVRDWAAIRAWASAIHQPVQPAA